MARIIRWFAIALWSLCAATVTEAQTTDSLAEKLASVPVELYLADSSLRIVNVYRPEAMALLTASNVPRAQVVEHLVRDAYEPYAGFWRGYLGDEAAFRKWATASLFADGHPIHTKLSGLLGLRLDSLFAASARWLVMSTRHRPTGVWYIVFGPGWTDLGGFSDGSMVVDFTKAEPDRSGLELKLPHELTHMVHGASLGQRNDPDSGTVLQRIVSEGLASYASCVYGAGRYTPAQCVYFTETDWTWALAHEKQILDAARPFLNSRARADLNRFASRSERLVDAGPTAIAYFVGFRIVQAYVGAHGPSSWTDVIDLPVRAVLSRSGYAL